MSRLPALKSLKTEDFPKDQQGWIPRLLQPLNQFMLTVYQLLNGNLQFGNNIRAQIQEFTFEGSEVRFQSEIGRPQGLVLISIQDISASPTAITAACQPLWTYQGTQVVIQDVLGVSSGQKYRIRVLCF